MVFGFSDAADNPTPFALRAVIIVTPPTPNTLTLNGMPVGPGPILASAPRNLVYTPTPQHASGNNFASFLFRVQDTGGGPTDTSVSPNHDHVQRDARQ